MWDIFFQILGFIGAGAALFAYGKAIKSPTYNQTQAYCWWNIFTGVAIGLSCWVFHAYGSVLLNVIWAALAIQKLCKIRMTK